MLWFVLYSLLFIVLSYLESRKGQSAEDYFLNSRRSNAHQVGFSIVASCVGGSATVGMCGLAFAVGMPAVWWLLSGACGLGLLRVFMVPRIRERLQALTMPEMVEGLIGKPAHRLSCLIIVCAWAAILAAQFLAMGRIVEAMTGLALQTAMACGALVIVIYTWLGGQASVIKSDVIQMAVMAAGLVLIFVVLTAADAEPLRSVPIEWLNDDFALSDWSRFMLLIGGSYVVCPMLFARVMSAQSESAARRGTTLGIVGIVFFAFLITAIGIEARAFVPAGTAGDAVLPQLVSQLPDWAGTVFFFVMASAILSSADSCLITAATVAANDVLQKPSVAVSRRMILVLSVAALVIAVFGESVLGLLLAANSMYVCAVVVPIFVALAANRALEKTTAAVSIAAAGSLALAGELLSIESLSYIAAAVSLSGSILALMLQNRRIPRPAAFCVVSIRKD